MRSLFLLLGSAAVIGGCTTSPPKARSAAAEQHLQSFLAGKVAGAPQSCLPSYRSSDMVIIDGDTVVFRDGESRVWRSDLSRGCARLGSGYYTLVSRRFGGQGLCRGEIAELVDLSTGTSAGTCVWGDFVPYTAPGI